MQTKKPVSKTLALKRALEKNSCKKGAVQIAGSSRIASMATSALVHAEQGSDLAIAKLDQIIRQLLEHRAVLAKNKVEPAPIGRQVRGVRQPSISLSIDEMTTDTIVHVKHAGLGWFSFTLGEQQIRDLLPILTHHQSVRGNQKLPRTLNA